jgi:prepilin-type N-terminal cleavage/methylation domain-containing protein
MNKKGFTLIELLVVIAIISILAVVVFVALDPATRFAAARDAVRENDTQELLSAIKIHQVDNNGDYLSVIDGMATNAVYMIGTTTSNCDDYNSYCDEAVDGDAMCVNLGDLVTGGYIGEIPVSPEDEVAWTTVYTGYTLKRSVSGIITVQACESEGTGVIDAAR